MEINFKMFSKIFFSQNGNIEDLLKQFGCQNKFTNFFQQPKEGCQWKNRCHNKEWKERSQDWKERSQEWKERNHNKEAVHPFVVCDGCQKGPIIGNRYKCNGCEDFDFCQTCYETKISTHFNKEHSFTLIERPHHKRFHCHNNGDKESHWKSKCKELKEKYHNEPIHFRVTCDGCQKGPIIGNRYKCDGCEDFDFCQTCYEKLKEHHPKEHSFTLIEKPQCGGGYWRRFHHNHHNNHHHQKPEEEKKEQSKVVQQQEELDLTEKKIEEPKEEEKVVEESKIVEEKKEEVVVVEEKKWKQNFNKKWNF